jgi:primosomal protein N' (replication factor Y)
VTKGYHFPNLTLVGVVDADLGLQGGDLRAAERSFQQIQQVAGRAGRGDKPGRVLIQTHDPDAPVIDALVSGDAPGFYSAETEARREAAMPPFGRLAAIIVSSENKAEADAVARRIGEPRPASRNGGVQSRPPARRTARPPPPAAAGPRRAQARRPGRHPRLAGRARVEQQDPRRGRCRSYSFL